MSRSSFSLTLICVAALLSGCTAVPLPEDVSGATTLQIVKRIRCEARDAVAAYAIKYMIEPRQPRATREEGERINANPAELARMRLATLDKYTRDYFKSYMKTFLYYEFTLDISEGTTRAATIGFLHTFSNGTHGLGASTSLERSNQNTRTFRIGDTIEDLMSLYLDPSNSDELYDQCAGGAKAHSLYPITGKIGLKEFIDTFAELDRGTPLTPKEKVDDFVETLLFVTTVKGGVNPTIVLSSIGGSVALTEAGIDVSATRVDKHQVILSIAARRTGEADAAVKVRAKANLNTYKDQNEGARGYRSPTSLDILQSQ